MSEINIDTAQEEDAAVIAEVLSDASEYKLSLGDIVWGKDGWSEQEVKDYMSESIFYLVKQDGQIIGTVSLQWDDERNWGAQPPVAGYLHRLAIKDGYRGQNIGKKVIDWAESQVAERGRHYLRLDCEEKNTKLCSYYEDLGFQKVGTRPVSEYGDYVAALFEKPVVMI